MNTTLLDIDTIIDLCSLIALVVFIGLARRLFALLEALQTQVDEAESERERDYGSG